MKIDLRYVFTAGLAVLFSLSVGGYVANTLAMLSVLLLATALLQILLFSRALRVELVEPQGRLEAGEKIRLAINLENRGFMNIPYIRSDAEHLGDHRVISIPARDRASLPYDLRPQVRGILDVGTVEVGVSDVLNILTRRRRIETRPVRIYPAVRSDRTRELALDTVGEGSLFRTYSRENPYVVRELRRYQPGDSFRKINWKVSARYNELLVRRGETTQEKDILIILDMNEKILQMDPEGIYENALVTDALSLSRGLLEEGIPHGFIRTDSRHPFFDISTMEVFSQLEEDLLTQKADAREPLAEFIAEKKEFLHERGTLLFFTRPLSSDLEACEQLIHERNEVVVFAPQLGKSGAELSGSRLILKELEGPGYEMA